jgi:hypothetical protein
LTVTLTVTAKNKIIIIHYKQIVIVIVRLSLSRHLNIQYRPVKSIKPNKNKTYSPFGVYWRPIKSIDIPSQMTVH